MVDALYVGHEKKIGSNGWMVAPFREMVQNKKGTECRGEQVETDFEEFL